MSELALRACPACDSERSRYAFSRPEFQVQSCPDCGFMFVNPQPSEETLKKIYSADYFLGGQTPEAKESRRAMKRATAQLYLKDFLAYHGSSRGRLLEIGCGEGDFLLLAQEAGFEVAGLEFSPSSLEEANRRLGAERVKLGGLEQMAGEEGRFDACVLFDAIEHVRQPVAELKKIHALLKPEGTLFIVTPSLESFSAKLLKQNWMEFKTEHLHYFDTQTIQNVLAKSGFAQVRLRPNLKVLSPDYVKQHFDRFRVPVLSRLLAFLHALSPKFLMRQQVLLPSSGMNVLARRGDLREKPLLSIIVPVYNEAATFPELMRRLLGKSLEGLEREIILVESNSKDGTRAEVLKFQGQEGIRVILEEKAQGKGHAVRAGIQEAKGDILIIQDGDLEYDVNDYDQLLEPLKKFQKAFVLGSRHSGSWKIREFSNKPLLTSLVNGAHISFAFMINLACGANLKDPFTMYKVFRRDCVWGLKFKADRFDFDWELVIKLLRKGYKPLEVPVNYLSRSWEAGKKIRIFRDPPTWIWALIRFRLERLNL